MKLCPECSTKSANSVESCECGYCFLDDDREKTFTKNPSCNNNPNYYVQPDPTSLRGPFTIEQIRGLCLAGDLKYEYAVQRDGDQEWLTIEDLINPSNVTNRSSAPISQTIKNDSHKSDDFTKRFNWSLKGGDFLGGLVVVVILNLIIGWGSRVGAIMGYIVGLMPLLSGRRRHPGLGALAFVGCGIIGAFSGLLGAIPVAFVTWLIIKTLTFKKDYGIRDRKWPDKNEKYFKVQCAIFCAFATACLFAVFWMASNKVILTSKDGTRSLIYNARDFKPQVESPEDIAILYNAAAETLQSAASAKAIVTVEEISRAMERNDYRTLERLVVDYRATNNK